MSRISETPDGVLETYDWQDVAEDLKEKLIKIKEIISYYATENEDYSKIYNQEEQEIMKVLEEIK